MRNQNLGGENMSIFPATGGGSSQNFQFGVISGQALIVVIASHDLRDQSRYTTESFNVPNATAAITWFGDFTAPPGLRSNSFSGPASFRSVMVGRYQYV